MINLKANMISHLNLLLQPLVSSLIASLTGICRRLGGNKLSGTIPNSIGQLTKLTWL